MIALGKETSMNDPKNPFPSSFGELNAEMAQCKERGLISRN
jgi:hypothetical protein